MVDFNFSLDKVLKVRAIRENKAQNKFLQAQKEKIKIQNKLKKNSGEQKQLYNFVRNNNLSLEETVQARNYLQLKRKKINQIQENLIQQKEKVEKRRNKMVAKKKKKEVMENLKEKEYERFYNDLLHKEQKEIDEIAQRLERRIEI